MDPKDLLIRVLKGNATRQQRLQLEQWLDSINAKKGISSNSQELPPTTEDLLAIRELVLTNFQAQRKRRRTTTLGMIMMTLLVTTSILLIRINTKQPVLVFKNATLDQIIPTIESTYSVSIAAAPVILPCTFSGEFHGVQSPQEVLSVLSIAMGLQYVQKNEDEFEITGNPCN